MPAAAVCVVSRTSATSRLYVVCLMCVGYNLHAPQAARPMRRQPFAEEWDEAFSVQVAEAGFLVAARLADDLHSGHRGRCQVHLPCQAWGQCSSTVLCNVGFVLARWEAKKAPEASAMTPYSTGSGQPQRLMVRTFEKRGHSRALSIASAQPCSSHETALHSFLTVRKLLGVMFQSSTVSTASVQLIPWVTVHGRGPAKGCRVGTARNRRLRSRKPAFSLN